MKKGILAILIICAAVIAGSVLMLTGVIKLTPSGSVSEESAPGAVVKVPFMSVYFGIDASGYVTGTVSEGSDIPLVSGISFTHIEEGAPAGTNDNDALVYALNVVSLLKTNGITGIEEIASDGEGSLTLITGNIKIELGKSKDTAAKLEDLSHFYSQVAGMSGTLDMTSVSQNNQGYTFKKSSGEIVRGD